MPFHYVDAHNDVDESTLFFVARADYREDLQERIIQMYSADFRIRFEHMLSLSLQWVLYGFCGFDRHEIVRVHRRQLEWYIENLLGEGADIMRYHEKVGSEIFEILSDEATTLYDPMATASQLLPELIDGVDEFGEREYFGVQAGFLTDTTAGMIREGCARYVAGA